MFRAVIVDDERLARRELRALLEGASRPVTVVGEAETVAGAAELIRATDADLVFLDVQLRHELGFDLLPALAPGVAVVFVTAFDQYAIRAFEENALDYLLKPVIPDRLVRTLDRLGQAPGIEPSLRPLTIDDFLFVSDDEAMRLVRVRQVAAVSAERERTTIRLLNGSVVSSRIGIGEWERRLPSPPFERVHRGTIVNLEHVDRFEEWSHSGYLVYIRGSTEPLRMSRRCAAELRRRLG